MKHIFSLSSLLLFPLISSFGMGGPKPLTVMVVPAEPNMVRIGLDMAEREDVLLMSYAPTSKAEDPFMHVWNGSTWLRVPSTRYSNGTFLKNNPGTVVILGGNDAVTTALIERAVDWSPEVLNIEPGQVTEVINSLGKLFQFSRSDWQWFAAEYDLTLENLNAGKKEAGWYDSNKPEDIPRTQNPISKSFGKSADSDVPDSNLETINVPPVSEPPKQNAPVEETVVPEVIQEDFSMDVNEL